MFTPTLSLPLIDDLPVTEEGFDFEEGSSQVVGDGLFSHDNSLSADDDSAAFVDNDNDQAAAAFLDDDIDGDHDASFFDDGSTLPSTFPLATADAVPPGDSRWLDRPDGPVRPYLSDSTQTDEDRPDDYSQPEDADFEFVASIPTSDLPRFNTTIDDDVLVPDDNSLLNNDGHGTYDNDNEDNNHLHDNDINNNEDDNSDDTDSDNDDEDSAGPLVLRRSRRQRTTTHHPEFVYAYSLEMARTLGIPS